MTVQGKEPPAKRIRQKIFEPVAFGRYCLIDQISKGGMSDIFLAKLIGANGFQKPVVIKKLLPEYTSKPSFVKRFLNEAKTLARLNHSNVAQIFDMGVIEGEYYISLEYIEGRNVAHVVSKAVKSNRLPTLDFVLHVVMELGRGLAHVHRKRGESGENLMLVHQDINSFNVMVSYEAEVKIIDFGIAQIFLDKQDSEEMPVAGKLLYFSPEQLQRKPLDRRVDVYGVGVLMYELLTGQRLVDHRETIADTVRAILEIDVNQKVGSDPKIPDQLKPILMKAMAFDPEKRYTWMEEMIRDIKAVIRTSMLEMDLFEISAYMKEQFHREILLDRRRLRKLMSQEPVASVRGKSRSWQPHLRISAHDSLLRLEEEPLEVSSWPFAESTATDEQWATPGGKPLAFPRGEHIFRQGDPGRDVFIILRGAVRIFISVHGVEQTLAILKEGDFFGESAIIGEFQRASNAVAHEDCELVSIDRDEFAQLFNSELSLKVVVNLVHKLRDCCSILEGSLLQDTLSRLIFGLLYLQRTRNWQNGADIDLARLKEMFRLNDTDQLKKYLRKLETLNAVQTEGGHIRIKSSDTLESILHVLRGDGKFFLKW
jgi:serine/threonine-protein kinase